MKGLPPLLKPYYSIEAAFKRLNLAGANLDNENDIYLLAAENNISIHVLLHGSVTLLKDSFYKPHYLKVEDALNFNPGQEAIDFSLEHLNMSKDEIKTKLHRINHPTLMIPRHLFEDDIVDAIDKVELEYVFDEDGDCISSDIQSHISVLQTPGVLDSFFSLSSTSFPIPVKLMDAGIDWKRQMYGELKELDFINNNINFLSMPLLISTMRLIIFVKTWIVLISMKWFDTRFLSKVEAAFTQALE